VAAADAADRRAALLRRVDAYLDAAPDDSATGVDVGPLRAFESRAPWPFYVRPRPELDLGAADAVSADDVRRAAAVLADAGESASFEWVEQLVPSLGPALVEAGFVVSSHPLLTLDLTVTSAEGRSRAGTGAGGRPASIRILDAGSPDLAVAVAVSDVGFAAAGTATGPEGTAERDAVDVDPSLVEYLATRISEGRSVVAVLDDEADGVVAAGWHQPIGDVTELVAVATLPAYRRRGAAADIVRVLVADARRRGCTLALLAAGDDAVARVYEHVGFTRSGTCGAAEPG
jgi:GNAT superfamily N-acetyltransferase